MESIAADLAERLAACAEAVCHHYLPNGVRRGSYWIVGDVSGAKGRSLYVRLRSSSSAAAGHWTDAASGQHGDLLDLIRLNRGLPTLREAFEEARMFLNEPPQARRGTSVSTAETSDRRKPSEAAARLFALTSPIPGTISRDLSAGPRHYRRSRPPSPRLPGQLLSPRRGQHRAQASACAHCPRDRS